MRVVTAPVTSSTSAWRGEATTPRPKRCEVVVRARRERQLVLAAVARAGVDVADREAAAAARAAAARSRGGGGGGRGAASASAVGAGVAELEALVDEREVGQQVAGGGVRDRRASWRTSRCAGGAARSGRRRARRRSVVAPRGLSTRPTPISALRAARLARRPARPGRRAGASSSVERLPQLERALLEPRLHVAGGALAATTGAKPS